MRQAGAEAAGADARGGGVRKTLARGGSRAACDAVRAVASLHNATSRVGLFVSAPLQCVKRCLPWPDVLQCYGDERPAECEQFNVPTQRALCIKKDRHLSKQAVRCGNAPAQPPDG